MPLGWDESTTSEQRSGSESRTVEISTGFKTPSMSGTDRIPPDGTFSDQSSDIDLERWPGWADMLSEPAHFNTLLEELGVKGVKVREVVSLEPEDLAMLPQPIHALIFLFRWKELEHEDHKRSSHEHIWFAEQVADNACATNALLNIVNNIEDLALGSELHTFKLSTQDLSPLEKGHEVNRYDFVRATHNSFATKAEIRDGDMCLKRDIAAARRAQHTKARRAAKLVKKEANGREPKTPIPTRTSTRTRDRSAPSTFIQSQDTATTKRKSRITKDEDPDPSQKRAKLQNGSRAAEADRSVCSQDVCAKKNGTITAPESVSSRRTAGRRSRTDKLASDGDSAHHYCAFMPIKDQLWKLDGLQRVPQKVGDTGAPDSLDWLAQVVEILKQFMASYPNGTVDFNIMAVVSDPLLTSKTTLVENIKSVQVVEEKLAAIVEDWQDAQSEGGRPVGLINGVDAEYGIAQSDLDNTDLSASFTKELNDLDDLASLLNVRKTLSHRQLEARRRVAKQLKQREDDRVQSYFDRHDYSEFFDTWLDELSQADTLEILMMEADQT